MFNVFEEVKSNNRGQYWPPASSSMPFVVPYLVQQMVGVYLESRGHLTELRAVWQLSMFVPKVAMDPFKSVLQIKIFSRWLAIKKPPKMDQEWSYDVY